MLLGFREYFAVDEGVVGTLGLRVVLRQIVENPGDAHRQESIDLPLAHLDHLVRSDFGLLPHVLLQGFERWILLEKLHDCILSWLLPV